MEKMRVVAIAQFLFIVATLAHPFEISKTIIPEAYKSPRFQKFVTHCASHVAASCSGPQAAKQYPYRLGLGPCIFNSMQACLVDHGATLYPTRKPNKAQDQVDPPDAAGRPILIEALKFETVLRGCAGVTSNRCWRGPNVIPSKVLAACIIPTLNQCVYGSTRKRFSYHLETANKPLAKPLTPVASEEPETETKTIEPLTPVASEEPGTVNKPLAKPLTPAASEEPEIETKTIEPLTPVTSEEPETETKTIEPLTPVASEEPGTVNKPLAKPLTPVASEEPETDTKTIEPLTPVASEEPEIETKNVKPLTPVASEEPETETETIGPLPPISNDP